MVGSRDILIVSTSTHAAPEGAFETHPPAGDPPLPLGGALYLEQLPHDEAERFMDACVPRGWSTPRTRQFGQLYSFVRYDPPGAEFPEFDPDETILSAVVLSRLIRPSSLCYEWALRISCEYDRERVMPLDQGAFWPMYPTRQSAAGWTQPKPSNWATFWPPTGRRRIVYPTGLSTRCGWARTVAANRSWILPGHSWSRPSSPWSTPTPGRPGLSSLVE